jgi:2Fe-2S ferredoxin
VGKSSIYVKNLNQIVPVKNEDSVLEVLLNNEIEIDHSCGGMGTCGTCRVFVSKPTVQQIPRNEVELERAKDLGFQDRERLCCQLSPSDFDEVEIPTITVE